MVNVRDAAVFMMILIGGLAVFIGVGGLDLAGSQTTNIVCDMPIASSTDYCSPATEPGDRYNVEHGVTVNRNSIVDTSFKYRTSKAGGGFPLSFTGSQFSILGEGRNVVLEYYLSQDGTLIASDSERLGTVGSFETEEVTFNNKLDSGNYELEYVVYGEECSVLSCTDFEDELSTTINVPKLPLGEY